MTRLRIIPVRPVERSAHENAVRSQGLRDGGGILRAPPPLYEAAKRVRDAGFKRWDVYSPFPIHGMDEAMGLGKSWLSAVVLIGGITGLLTAVILEFGPSWFIYPLIVHGKPFIGKRCRRFSRSCSS
jgi:hypothetical protein